MIKYKVYDVEDCGMWLTKDYEDLVYSYSTKSTRVFDQNEDEVFEGDEVMITSITKVADENVYHNEYEFLVGTLKKFNDCWAIDTGYSLFCLRSDEEKNMIMGNIYENLVLLSRGKIK